MFQTTAVFPASGAALDVTYLHNITCNNYANITLFFLICVHRA